MKQYALVVKQDEMSANIAEKIKKGLTGIMEYNPDDPDLVISVGGDGTMLLSVHQYLSLIHISEPTRQAEISYAVFCLKKKK